MEPVNESTSGSLKWLVLPTLAAEVVLSGIMLGATRCSPRCGRIFCSAPRSVPPPRW